MEGTAFDRQLSACDVRPRSRVRFALAAPEQDAAIRRLLRDNPARGQISISFEREPDYARAANIGGAEDKTIVAFEGERLVCMGRCSVRRRWLNGNPHKVGYLADLRLDAAARGRFDILRRGYRFYRETYRDNPPDLFFTSIAADNQRSLRFLERELPGMPRYEALTHFETLFVPVPRNAHTAHRLSADAKKRLQSRGLECVTGSDDLRPSIVSCLNIHARQHQLASVWTADELAAWEPLGLAASRFQLLLDGNKPIACAALWDQRCFRQTVIREYGPGLSLARPWINLGSRWLGGPALPPAGSPLSFAVLSPLAVPATDGELLCDMIASCFPAAAERGLDHLALGFSANDPRLDAVRNRFRCRVYNTRLYRVRWDEAAEPDLDGRTMLPEIAFL